MLKLVSFCTLIPDRIDVLINRKSVSLHGIHESLYANLASGRPYSYVFINKRYFMYKNLLTLGVVTAPAWINSILKHLEPKLTDQFRILNMVNFAYKEMLHNAYRWFQISASYYTCFSEPERKILSYELHEPWVMHADAVARRLLDRINEASSLFIWQ
jgi:hypothetical protein